jgi:hypothetical protein
MRTRIMKPLSAAGPAGALTVLCLIGAGCAAPASPAPARPGPVARLAAPAVPGSFQPAAASFVSPAWGVVLGGAGCTASRACRARLAVTADGGAHWSVMRAPAVWLGGGSSPPQVSQVVFAGRADGWLYGPFSDHIWVTRNGGASWRQITLPGNVQAMAVAGTAVYAVTGKEYAVAGNRLYRSPLGRNAWRPASPWPQSGPMTGGSILAVSGHSVWFGSSTYVWTTADGVHWARYPFRCSGLADTQPYMLAGISAASPRDVAFLCVATPGTYGDVTKVLVSVNGARSGWQTLTAAAPPVGDVAAFAVAPGRRLGLISIAVVVPDPASFYRIYRLPGLGHSWTTSVIPGATGGALNSLQFMSPAAGSFVMGDPGWGIHGELWRTTDAGQIWHPVRF